MISNQTHTSNTTELAETKQHKFHVKDPGSALTHFIAMIGAAIAAVPLLHKAAEEADSRHLAALAVFIISMILLYAASTTYHTFNISEHVNKILRKIDHMMIFILIAGTYTPVTGFWRSSGVSRSLGFSSTRSGSTARSGFLRWFTSRWAGSVCWPSGRSCWHFRKAPFSGC